jgi:hypothetical protein
MRRQTPRIHSSSVTSEKATGSRRGLQRRLTGELEACVRRGVLAGRAQYDAGGGAARGHDR